MNEGISEYLTLKRDAMRFLEISLIVNTRSGDFSESPIISAIEFPLARSLWRVLFVRPLSLSIVFLAFVESHGAFVCKSACRTCVFGCHLSEIFRRFFRIVLTPRSKSQRLAISNFRIFHDHRACSVSQAFSLCVLLRGHAQYSKGKADRMAWSLLY